MCHAMWCGPMDINSALLLRFHVKTQEVHVVVCYLPPFACRKSIFFSLNVPPIKSCLVALFVCLVRVFRQSFFKWFKQNFPPLYLWEFQLGSKFRRLSNYFWLKVVFWSCFFLFLFSLFEHKHKWWYWSKRYIKREEVSSFVLLVIFLQK